LRGEKVEVFDSRLHLERLTRRTALADECPHGGMIFHDGAFFARRKNRLLRWSFSGYTQALEFMPAMQAKVLTPPSIIAILRTGYQPRWHTTALQWDD